jgi:hypothetical protein
VRRREAKYLIFAAKAALAAGMISAAAGCAHVHEWQPVCRHKAVLAATVAGEDLHPVRIQIGEMAAGGRHAQAQAWIRGEWRYLEFDGVAVWTGEKDAGFEPDRDLTLLEALARWHAGMLLKGKEVER